MTDIDTPTHEMANNQKPEQSVNTTVPVEQAQKKGAGSTTANSNDSADTPHLPHERDQSVGMTDGNPSPKVQQAFKDVERGLVNTDAGREAHNVGKPVNPAEPALPGTPGPIEPDHK